MTIMDGPMALIAAADRLEAFRKSDAERDALVSEVINHYEQLKIKYDEAVDDLSNEKLSRRQWQTTAGEREQELQQHKQVSGSNNFVVAAIDGDGALFLEKLYARRADGGAEAAFHLRSGIQDSLKKTYPKANVADWNIVVQVFLNLQGLAIKLLNCGVISHVNDLYDFARAFSVSQPLFSFVDVGHGKERADHKIRETLRLYMPIAQCKHVFFAPCHDNGYLLVLEPYKHDSTMASRLTLIETRPAEIGFVKLGFERIRMETVFRATDLPPNKLSADLVPSPPPAMAAKPVPGIATNSIPVARSASPATSVGSGSLPNTTSWATVGKTSSANKIIDIASKPVAQQQFVLANADEERLDTELPRKQSAAEQKFEQRTRAYGHVCNMFHLTGHCPSGSFCSYKHGEQLSPGELLVLRHKARGFACAERGWCRHVKCIYGHTCMYPGSCPHGESCRFSFSHRMDTEPAKRVYEDGTEEWLPSYLNKRQS